MVVKIRKDGNYFNIPVKDLYLYFGEDSNCKKSIKRSKCDKKKEEIKKENRGFRNEKYD